MTTADGQFAPSLRPWVGGPDRAWPVGGRVWDRAFRQHPLPSGNTAGGVQSNEVRFHLSLLASLVDVVRGSFQGRRQYKNESGAAAHRVSESKLQVIWAGLPALSKVGQSVPVAQGCEQ